MNSTDQDDRALVEAFGVRRDEQSFRELYRRYTPMVFAMAVRLCGSRSDAEEFTQEAWVRAVARHERYNSRSAYSTWVVGILINCARLWQRLPAPQCSHWAC